MGSISVNRTAVHAIRFTNDCDLVSCLSSARLGPTSCDENYVDLEGRCLSCHGGPSVISAVPVSTTARYRGRSTASKTSGVIAVSLPISWSIVRCPTIPVCQMALRPAVVVTVEARASVCLKLRKTRPSRFYAVCNGVFNYDGHCGLANFLSGVRLGNLYGHANSGPPCRVNL